MTMLAINDNFVFPFNELDQAHGHIACQHMGLTQRGLFAAILMHAELVTDGVPGEACDALVAAAAESGREVEDQMAFNAVLCADALLRALADEPPARQYRNLYADEQARIDAAERLAAVIQEVTARPGFPPLPDDLRKRLDFAVQEIIEPPIPF